MSRELTAREFAQKMGLAEWTVQDYCRQGRIPRARREGRRYRIPEDAGILGDGVRFSGSRRGLSAAEYAQQMGVSAARVYALLRQGRIERAKKDKSGWSIPENAPWPGGPPGRPPKGGAGRGGRK